MSITQMIGPGGYAELEMDDMALEGMPAPVPATVHWSQQQVGFVSGAAPLAPVVGPGGYTGVLPVAPTPQGVPAGAALNQQTLSLSALPALCLFPKQDPGNILCSVRSLYPTEKESLGPNCCTTQAYSPPYTLLPSPQTYVSVSGWLLASFSSKPLAGAIWSPKHASAHPRCVRGTCVSDASNPIS